MKITSHARLAGCLTLLAALAAAAPTHAGLITGTISGQVTAVGSAVSSGVAAGDLVVGSYSYDDSVVVDNTNPFESFSISIGALTFGLADLMDRTYAHGRIVFLSTDDRDVLDFLLNWDSARILVGSSAISQSFTRSDPQIYEINDDAPNGRVAFNFTATPTGTAVPEPSSLALGGIGFLGVAAVVRRRRPMSVSKATN